MNKRNIQLQVRVNGRVIFSLGAWRENALETSIQYFHNHEKIMAIGDDLRLYSSDGITHMLLAQRVKGALL